MSDASSVDALLARSWASRAALSRSANVEGQAASALQNSVVRGDPAMLANEKYGSEGTPPPPSPPKPIPPSSSSSPVAPPPASSSTATTASLPLVADLSNGGAGGSTTFAAIRRGDAAGANRQQSPSLPAGTVVNCAAVSPVAYTRQHQQQQQQHQQQHQQYQSLIDQQIRIAHSSSSSLTTSSRDIVHAYVHQQNNYEPISSSIPLTTALVDLTQSPIIPTNRGYRDFFKEAAEDGGIHLFTAPESSSMASAARQRHAHHQQLLGRSPPVSSGQQQQQQQQLNYSSSSTTRSVPLVQSLDQQHLPHFKTGQEKYIRGGSANFNNRTMETVVDEELVFLHQAYGDPTLSVVTHWLLLHQNLALELLARHWMTLIDATRLTYRHDRVLTSAALTQLRAAQDTAALLRKELAEERAKPKAPPVVPPEHPQHQQHLLPQTVLGRSAATTPTRDTSPLRSGGGPSVSLAPGVSVTPSGNSSRAAAILPPTTSPARTAGAGGGAAPQPLAARHILPHASAHVPLVWNSSIIQGVPMNEAALLQSSVVVGGSSSSSTRRGVSPFGARARPDWRE